jgi:hypothetical protein
MVSDALLADDVAAAAQRVAASQSWLAALEAQIECDVQLAAALAVVVDSRAAGSAASRHPDPEPRERTPTHVGVAARPSVVNMSRLLDPQGSHAQGMAIIAANLAACAALAPPSDVAAAGSPDA